MRHGSLCRARGPVASGWRKAVLPGLLLACAGPSLAAGAGPIDPDEALRLSQAAIGQTVGDYRFTDQDNRPLDLARLRGRPVIVSFIYTSCAFVCPMLTSSLARSVELAREVLGPDSVSVISLGFDTRVDTPEQMRLYAAQRGISVPGWYFVSGDDATVARFAQDVGFSYAPLAGGFDHLAQVTIIDADGRVYRQVYGPDFSPPMIVDPVKKLALGISTPERPVADFLNKVRLLCTSYDPKSGRYRFDYSLILEIGIGLSCAIGFAVFAVRAWRQGRAASSQRA
ncbi:MAG: SCO family protein [Gammaproteobacteria bacterium]|nr:SCO family protein [Gammaproteobacteria bacterium]